jgi:hypothetical protein
MQGQAYLNLLALVRWTADDHVVYGEVVQHNAHLPDMHKEHVIQRTSNPHAVNGLLSLRLTGMGGTPLPWSENLAHRHHCAPRRPR